MTEIFHSRNTHRFMEEEYSDFHFRYNEFMKNFQGIPDLLFQIGRFDPNRIKGSLDLNEYLKLFNYLSIDEGYVLDYLYSFDGRGGQPFPYTRKESQTPIDDLTDYLIQFDQPNIDMLLGQSPKPGDMRPWLSHIKFEPINMGYVQFALFCLKAHKFYLYWHSLYNDITQILTRKGLERYFRENKEKIKTLSPKDILEINYQPVLDQVDKIGKIRFLAFDTDGGSLYWQYVTVAWPNIFIDESTELIIRGEKYLY